MPADSDELNWTKFVRFAALDLPAPPLKNSEVERVWRIYQSNIDRLTAMMALPALTGWSLIVSLVFSEE